MRDKMENKIKCVIERVSVRALIAARAWIETFEDT